MMKAMETAMKTIKNNDQKNVNYGDIVDDNNRNIDDLKYYY